MLQHDCGVLTLHVTTINNSKALPTITILFVERSDVETKPKTQLPRSRYAHLTTSDAFAGLGTPFYALLRMIFSLALG